MWWLAVVALFGCGDNLVDESAGDHSGTQLKLRWFEYPDGARELAWSDTDGVLFDARFDARCELVEWADGVTRCTPGARRGVFEEVVAYAVGAFTDDACTQLVGRSIGEPDFVVVGEFRGGQHYPTQLFRGGTLIPKGIFYERQDGRCAGPFDLIGTSNLFEVGSLVPTSALVALEERTLPTTGRLAHRAASGTDGSELWRGFHDRELGVDCSIRCVADGYRCVPSIVPPDGTAVGQFAPITLAVEATGRRLDDRVAVAGNLRRTVGLFDTVTSSSCSALQEPFYSVDQRCVPFAGYAEDAYAESTCQTPVRVARRELGDCVFTFDYAYAYEAQQTVYFEVREPLAEAFVRTDAGNCVPFGVPASYQIHALGPAIPLDSFATATVVVD